MSTLNDHQRALLRAYAATIPMTELADTDDGVVGNYLHGETRVAVRLAVRESGHVDMLCLNGEEAGKGYESVASLEELETGFAGRLHS